MSSNAYDFTLAAAIGASQRIDVTGTQALIRTLSGNYDLELKTDTGKIYRVTAGQGFECTMPGESFGWIQLRNLQAVAITGTISIGDAGYVDKTITGNVKVVDQSVDKTIAGFQFFASITRGAAAGVFSIAGLRALTFRTSIKRLQVSSGVAGLISIYAANGDPTVNPNNTPGAGVNKVVRDGVNSSARALRGEAAAAVPTVGELPGAFALAVVRVAANTPTEILLTTPLLLNVNNGLVAIPQTANADVSLYIDWEDFL